MRFVPAAGDEFTDAEMRALASLGAAAVMRNIEGRNAEGGLLPIQPAVDATPGIFLGNGVIRYFIDGNGADASKDFVAGFYVVNFESSVTTSPNVHLGDALSVASNSFRVVMPTVDIAAPVAGDAPSTGGRRRGDRGHRRQRAERSAGWRSYYIDVIFGFAGRRSRL
jgi:hypothetical protein